MERNFTLSEDINGPLLAAGLAIQMTGALIANTVIFITTLLQSKSLKLPSTVLFTSLIIIHFVMAVFYMPFWLITAATGEWIFGRTAEQKEGTCKFVGFILWYSILVISMTLAAISVDRFLFIVKPQFYKQFMRPKVAVTLVVISLASSCIIKQYTILLDMGILYSHLMDLVSISSTLTMYMASILNQSTI